MCLWSLGERALIVHTDWNIVDPCQKTQAVYSKASAEKSLLRKTGFCRIVVETRNKGVDRNWVFSRGDGTCPWRECSTQAGEFRRAIFRNVGINVVYVLTLACQFCFAAFRCTSNCQYIYMCYIDSRFVQELPSCKYPNAYAYIQLS